MKEIIIDSEVFDEIKKACSPHIKDKCDYCGCEINKKTFGFSSRDITCCKDLFCLIQATEEERLKEDSESNEETKK